jgi:hypothetical protein
VQKNLEELASILRFIVVDVPREKAMPKKRRTKPVLKKAEDTPEEKAPKDTAVAEELDREIEKLMVD